MIGPAPGGPAGAALLLVLIGAWLLALPRLLLRRRTAAPGLTGAVFVAALACAALSAQLGLLDALALLDAAPPIQRRLLLSAALEEALSPVPAALLIAALAVLPHAPLAALERPSSGLFLTWTPRLLAAVAGGMLLLAIGIGWEAWSIYEELSPTLHQLDAPPDGIYSALVDEARPHLETSVGATLGALGTALVAGGTALLGAVVTLVRNHQGLGRAQKASVG